MLEFIDDTRYDTEVMAWPHLRTSRIRISMKDYSKGIGDAAVDVFYNLSPEELIRLVEALGEVKQVSAVEKKRWELSTARLNQVLELYRIPHDISELYEEGRKLSHCVGTYGKTVAEGRSVIAFIRKQSEVDTPLCTIEIRQDTIVQARGMSNRPAENIPKMKGFINAWAKNKGLIYAA